MVSLVGTAIQDRIQLLGASDLPQTSGYYRVGYGGRGQTTPRAGWMGGNVARAQMLKEAIFYVRRLSRPRGTVRERAEAAESAGRVVAAPIG